MSRLFISHSSENDFAAIAIKSWLSDNGWDDIFLDIDPARGLVAGERWEKALHDAANRCDAVLFLISPGWLASDWCRREYRLALRLNKRIFGVLIEELDITALPNELTDTWQVVDLASGTDHVILNAVHPYTGKSEQILFSQSGLARLRNGLVKAGLDPHFFDWPPKDQPDRPLFRGLKPLEVEDAGIFFGREAPTIELLAKLRGLRDGPPPRFMVILGASGAGKSSFLRAGILPRLLRDDRYFLPLPMVRPEQSALWGDSGLLKALEAACRHWQLPVTRAEIREAIDPKKEASSEPHSILMALLHQLVDIATPPSLAGEQPSQPIVVLPIDQAEELFNSEGAQEAKVFLEILRSLCDQSNLPFMVIATIRSDSYDQLQSAEALAGMSQQTFSLTPMPKGAFRDVIEGPIRRLVYSGGKLGFEPALTEQLLKDMDTGAGKDALPLLAFTLEYLYQEYSGDGELRLQDYRDMGGVAGAIEVATEKVFNKARQNPKLPDDRAALEAIARRALIPWLAGIDPETKAPRRRVARLSEIPAEASPIIVYMVEQRLLATDINSDDETTVEPAHEALLRQWGLLKGWLQSDFADLTTLESLQRATRDWEANGRSQAWLNHKAGRLEDAEKVLLRQDLSNFFTTEDCDYLAACRETENATKQKELREAKELAEAKEKEAAAQQRIAKRTRIGLVVAVLLVIVASVFGFNAKSNLDQANHNLGLTLLEKAMRAIQDKRFREARVFSAESLLLTQTGASKGHANGLIVGAATISQEIWWSPVSAHGESSVDLSFSPDGLSLASAFSDGSVRVWDITSGQRKTTLTGHTGVVSSVDFSPDGLTLASASLNISVESASWDKSIRLWDITSGQLKNTLTGHTGSVESVAFSPDGLTLASASGDDSIRLWDITSGQLKNTLTGHTGVVSSVAFSPDGLSLASAFSDGSIRLWDITSGQLKNTLTGHTSRVSSVAFSPDGLTLASASASSIDSIRLWDITSGQQLKTTLTGHTNGANIVAFSPDSLSLASASNDGSIRLWDITSGQLKNTLTGHTGWVSSVAFSPDGLTLASASIDQSIRLWDITSGQLKNTLTGHTYEASSVAFSPDGLTLASASEDDSIRLWDIRSGQLKNTLTGHTARVNSVAFSPDGLTLASASNDQSILLWDIASGQLKTTLTGHTDGVISFAFSPDGLSLASGYFDGSIWLWDITSGQLKNTLTGHTGWVNSVAFSPDGLTLASASNDQSIRLWDITSGQLKSTLTGHTARVNSVAFSPDGLSLASASRDESVNIWNFAEIESLLVSQNVRNWLESQRQAGISLNGIDIAYSHNSNLYGKVPAPNWPKSHPLHWQKKAEEGDAEAMLQLGIIAHRHRNFDKAHKWYNSALKAGHPRANERLKVLEMTRAMAEKSGEDL